VIHQIFKNKILIQKFVILLNCVRNEQIQNEDKFLLEKYTNVINLINNSMNVVRSQRPNCDEMLAEKEKWTYSSEDICRYIKENDKFSTNFLKSKLKSEKTFII
jgi:hypothetical protein